MFQRFTEPARQVVVHAQDEARSLGHEQLGTEHMLLGLLRVRDGLAARVLLSLGLTIDDAQAQVVRARGRGTPATSGQVIPFTRRGQRTLELALREALSLGHRYIGTEHILLGLVGDERSTGTQVLRELGFGAGAVRTEVMRLLSEGASSEPAATEEVAEAEPRAPRGSGWSGPIGAVALGWLAFGAAAGIGLLLGRLIWG